MDSMTNNKYVLKFINDTAKLTLPDKIVWVDGGRTQADALAAEAVKNGDLLRLNEKLLPNCYLHRSAQNDVARTERRTFICCKNPDDAGPTNNYREPGAAYAELRGILKNSYTGRTMYVIPFLMGAPNSRFALAGIELTDSIYVVLNMNIMTRVGADALRLIGAGKDFARCLHASCKLSEDERYVCHFPEDDAVWSVNSGYGGNALLGKKCFALRLAGRRAFREGWLAEHMLILGVQKPDGDVKYIAAAFPSACGKTNLAMLVPPKGYSERGYKVWCVGDDIAWLRVGADGTLRAVNPETGFFGVAPGTGEKSNPNAVAAARRDTIFTNVAQNLDDNTVWWEGFDGAPPKNALDWKGTRWSAESGEKGAHPNGRFTAPARNCPCLSPEFDNPDGVPISAVVFGGRRASLTPLVFEARDFAAGVFAGASMASETTAAASGETGVVRRDPMAMLPFCGYHMGDYFGHWLNIGKKLKRPPKFFHVNWFRKGRDGKFMWPGFSQNMRVLDWIIARCEGRVGAEESAIGLLPRAGDINLDDSGVSAETLNELLKIDAAAWRGETEAIGAFFDKFGKKLPAELRGELEKLKESLKEK